MRALVWVLSAAMLLISMWRWLSLADRGEPSLEPRQTATAARAVASVTAPEQAALEDYRFALERPLFHPSRRPFPDRKTLVALEAAAKAKQTVPAPAAPPPRPPSPPQGVQLRGTLLAGPLQSAVFERVGSQTYVRVREGEQLDGWTLVRIGREEIVLRQGNQSVAWPLTKANDGKANDGRQRRP
jgi:hypothetical protein